MPPLSSVRFIKFVVSLKQTVSATKFAKGRIFTGIIFVKVSLHPYVLVAIN